jgi:hypothetical protein
MKLSNIGLAIGLLFTASVTLADTKLAMADNSSTESASSDYDSSYKTLFSSNSSTSHSYGGYGQMDAQMSTIDGEAATFQGVRGGLIIDHKYIIGLGGNGLQSSIYDPLDESKKLVMGYGGLILGYTHKAADLIHLSSTLLVGAGHAGTYDPEELDFDSEDEDHEDREDIGRELFFTVFEPQLMAEVNLFPWMRVGAGITYRMVQGGDVEGMDDSDLSGASGMLSMKFGAF